MTYPTGNCTDAHNHLSPEVRDRLGYLERKLLAYTSARAIWNEIFTDEEREQLAGSFEQFCSRREDNMIAAYMRLNAIPQYQATIELAFQLNFINRAERGWLSRESNSEIHQDNQPPLKPIWNRENHVLEFGHEVIREVRRPNVARNIVAILDEFERQNWQRRIRDPLPGNRDPLRLAATLKSLNRGLDGILFYQDGTGEGVCWRRL